MRYCVTDEGKYGGRGGEEAQGPPLRQTKKSKGSIHVSEEERETKQQATCNSDLREKSWYVSLIDEEDDWKVVCLVCRY